MGTRPGGAAPRAPLAGAPSHAPRLLPRRLRSLHTLVLVLVLAGLGWLGWTWYRGSSFVKVHRVTVTGLSGPDVPQIRTALTDAALTMTTLDMRITTLESAVSQYPYVQAITVSHQGAHAVTIHVSEQVPVALVVAGGRAQTVDAQGQILRQATLPTGVLPRVSLRVAPAGGRVRGAGPMAVLAVLGAAPYRLLAHISNATSSSAHGVIVQLRHGPQLYFGPTDSLRRKWRAVVAVLQNAESAGAGYIDVTDPSQPAAGVGLSTSQAVALGLAQGTAVTGTAGSTGSTSQGTTTGTTGSTGATSQGATGSTGSSSQGTTGSGGSTSQNTTGSTSG